MSDLISDGKTMVVWASTVANVNTPTVAEITAGSDYTQRITPDGLKTDASTETVDTSSLASTFTTQEVGRRGFDLEVTFKRGSTPNEDSPYTTLTYGTHGYLIVRRAVAYTTAIAAGQTVEVYPVACGEPQQAAPAANEVMKFMSPMKLTTEPNTRATVA
jgi:hypothetical protein